MTPPSETISMTQQEVEARIKERNAKAEAAAARFAQVIQSGEVHKFNRALKDADECYCFQSAFRKIARLEAVPLKTQEGFLAIWLSEGDEIRSDVCNDLLLMDALRVLLPAYSGPDVHLFRGEGALNRKHRTYGMSWTSSRDVAVYFAEGNRSMYENGTVLVSTQAPASAIICVPHDHDNSYEEFEYIVDRRRLGRVSAEQRFSFKEPKIGLDE